MEIRRVLRELQEKYPDNWDGKGAGQPNEVALKRANLALDMLSSMQFTPLDIIPSIESGIAITFKQDTRYAEVEFFNAGDMCFALFDSTKEVEIDSFQPTKGDLRRTLHKICNFIKGEGNGTQS